MTNRVYLGKWALKFVTHIPLYFCASTIAKGIITRAFVYLAKLGATIPADLPNRHFLVISVIAGLIAGNLSKDMFQLTGLLPVEADPAPNWRPWREPQAWTWAPFTCVLIAGMILWIDEYTNTSVLAASSGITISGLFATFFAQDCRFPTNDFRTLFSSGCYFEAIFTNVWMGSIGYSAAQFVPADSLSRLLGRHHAPPTKAQTNEPEIKPAPRDFSTPV